MEDTLDKKAMISGISAQIREQILGIFGVEDEKICVAKLHGMVDLANSLGIQMNININLTELSAAKKKYVDLALEDEKEDA
jgi:hypothetical protein